MRYLESFLVAAVDASMAAQNAALAAESLGFGICYIGALRNRPEEVAEVLGLPPGAFALFGMCVGVPAAHAKADMRPRLPQELVVHHETYGAQKEGALVQAYDAVTLAHQRAQGVEGPAWSDRVVARLKDAEALDGRDRLKQALQVLGFGLE